MHANYPNIEIHSGQDEIDATMLENDKQSKSKDKKKCDLKLVIGRDNLSDQMRGKEAQANPKLLGVTIKYYYMAQKVKISWISSPRNDSLADSICLMILQINEKTSPQLV